MSSLESMEYEQARNLTLLFFFERLIDKNEPRTLHDLSCQFGAPGFTKEMRQIAGGSQSGKCHILILHCVIYCGILKYHHANAAHIVIWYYYIESLLLTLLFHMRVFKSGKTVITSKVVLKYFQKDLCDTKAKEILLPSFAY